MFPSWVLPSDWSLFFHSVYSLHHDRFLVILLREDQLSFEPGTIPTGCSSRRAGIAYPIRFFRGLAIRTVAIPKRSRLFSLRVGWSFAVPAMNLEPSHEPGLCPMNLDLKDKVVVITGGAKGIGAAMAEACASEGAIAVIADRDTEAGAQLQAGLETLGARSHFIPIDLSTPENCASVVEEAVNKFGRLDVLVNNAGTAIPKPFEETTLEEMERVLDINVRGVFVATQAALKHMTEGGRIIMIGSAVGERAVAPGLVPYAATKGAVKMFTQALSREVGGRGITVNNIQPGPIDTDLNPAAGDWAVPQKAATALDRYGLVDEVAALVAFVAGPESSYITGANLTVDGGTNA